MNPVSLYNFVPLQTIVWWHSSGLQSRALTVARLQSWCSLLHRSLPVFPAASFSSRGLKVSSSWSSKARLQAAITTPTFPRCSKLPVHSAICKAAWTNGSLCNTLHKNARICLHHCYCFNIINITNKVNYELFQQRLVSPGNICRHVSNYPSGRIRGSCSFGLDIFINPLEDLSGFIYLFLYEFANSQSECGEKIAAEPFSYTDPCSTTIYRKRHKLLSLCCCTVRCNDAQWPFLAGVTIAVFKSIFRGDSSFIPNTLTNSVVSVASVIWSMCRDKFCFSG